MSVLESGYRSGRFKILLLLVIVLFGGFLTLISEPKVYGAFVYVTLGAFLMIAPIIGFVFILSLGLLCVQLFYRSDGSWSAITLKVLIASALAFLLVPFLFNSWIAQKAKSYSGIKSTGDIKSATELVVHVEGDGDIKLSKIAVWLLANTSVETIYTIYDDDLDFYLNNTNAALLARNPRALTRKVSAPMQACSAKSHKQQGYAREGDFCVRTYTDYQSKQDVIANALNKENVRIRKWRRIPLNNCDAQGKNPVKKNRILQAGVCLQFNRFLSLPNVPILSYEKRIYDTGHSFIPARLSNSEQWRVFTRGGKLLGFSGSAQYQLSPYPYRFTFDTDDIARNNGATVQRDRYKVGPDTPWESLSLMLLGSAGSKKAYTPK